MEIFGDISGTSIAIWQIPKRGKKASSAWGKTSRPEWASGKVRNDYRMIILSI